MENYGNKEERKQTEKHQNKDMDWWMVAIQPESDDLHEILTEEGKTMHLRLKHVFFEEREALEVIVSRFSEHLIERLDAKKESNSRPSVSRKSRSERIADEQMRAWFVSKLITLVKTYGECEMPREIGEKV